MTRRRPDRARLAAGVFLVLASTLACTDSDPTRPGCSIEIVNPSEAPEHETSEAQVIVGGTISGAAFATWEHAATGASGEAFVVYAAPGAGSWMTNAVTLVEGVNRITVAARRYGIDDAVCARDTITVTRVP